MKRSLGFVVLVLTFASSAMIAATHPVPLELNMDTPKCLECHENKGKGKAVHSAIQMGCKTCHEVRIAKDVTRVKLTTTT